MVASSLWELLASEKPAGIGEPIESKRPETGAFLAILYVIHAWAAPQPKVA